MGTLKQAVDRVAAAKTAIGNAIAAKGGTVAAGDGLEEFAADIATIPSGGGSSTDKSDVNFYDYDGTIVASYTASDFAELTAMPANPMHEGLTAQGWNWTLSDAQTYVSTYGKLEIGQMYITSDGKTRLYIELTEGRLTPYLKLYIGPHSELDIDWGDGSTHSAFRNTTPFSEYKNEMHSYPSEGIYIIAITVVSGQFSLESSLDSQSTLLTNNNNSLTSPDRAYLKSINKIEIGNGVNTIGRSVFRNCRSLSSITIPLPVSNIGNYSFGNCYLLKSLTIPSSVRSIGENAFNSCNALTSLTIPNSVTSIGKYAFNSCTALTSLTIPSSVTSIMEGAFQYFQDVTSVTIPSSVTSIDKYAFYQCYALASITIPSSVASIGNDVFTNCYSLATITINKPTDSISGSPWGASTYSPTSTQIVWTG